MGCRASALPRSSIVLSKNRSPVATSVLTVGNDDQSGSFGGVIRDGGAPVALTKIGRGIQTLFNTNGFSGNTTISNGSLALSGGGSLSSANVLVYSGGSLDISDLTMTYAPANAVRLSRSEEHTSELQSPYVI